MAGKIDNSVLTPEFHMENNNGQVTDVTDMDQNQNPNVGNQQPAPVPQDGQTGEGDEGGVQGIQVGDEVFETQEDMIAAYQNIRKNYKELQGAYTKSRQEIAKQNKIARPMNTGMSNQQPVQQPINPYGYQPTVGQVFNRPMQYQQPYVQQPYVQQPYYAQQQAQNLEATNEALINLAIDNTINELKANDPEFDDVAVELWNIINDETTDIGRIKFTDPATAKSVLGAAYNTAKQKVELAKANIKINNARNEAYRSKQSKLANNDNSNVASKGNRQGAQELSPEEIIKQGIIGAKPQKF